MKLIKNNPYIVLNGEKIGVPQKENSKIPDKFFLNEEQKKLKDEK
jgi:hypothetical protein